MESNLIKDALVVSLFVSKNIVNVFKKDFFVHKIVSVSNVKTISQCPIAMC